MQPSLFYLQLDGVDRPVMGYHAGLWEGKEFKGEGRGSKRLAVASCSKSVSVIHLLLVIYFYSLVELGMCPLNEIGTLFTIWLSFLAYMLLQQRIPESVLLVLFDQSHNAEPNS